MVCRRRRIGRALAAGVSVAAVVLRVAAPPRAVGHPLAGTLVAIAAVAAMLAAGAAWAQQPPRGCGCVEGVPVAAAPCVAAERPSLRPSFMVPRAWLIRGIPGSQPPSEESYRRRFELPELVAPRRPRPGDRDWPDAMLRVVEDYEDLAEIKEGQAAVLPAQIAAARAVGNHAQVTALEARQHALRREVRDLRTRQAAILREVVARRPQYEHADAALFMLAVALDQQSDARGAAAASDDLAARFPSSPFATRASLLVAERDLAYGALTDARRRYERALAAAPGTPLEHLVLYRLAWTCLHLGDHAAARAAFVRLIAYLQARPDALEAAAMLAVARAELAVPYAATTTATRPRDVRRALADLRRLAADDDGALAMLEALARAYEHRGRWREARAVYQALVGQRPADARVDAWRRLAIRAQACGARASPAPASLRTRGRRAAP